MATNHEVKQIQHTATILWKRLTTLGVKLEYGHALEGLAAIEGYRNWRAFRAFLVPVGEGTPSADGPSASDRGDGDGAAADPTEYGLPDTEVMGRRSGQWDRRRHVRDEQRAGS